MNFTAFAQLGLAYLLGAIPSAFLAGRWLRGLDIRQHGSGNVGATNVFRVLGPGPGAAVLAVDIAKGAAAVLFIPLLAPQPTGLAALFEGLREPDTLWPCWLGLAAVLGHSYTPFLGFKGGKGVATSLGVFLGLAPLATAATLVVFGVVFLWSRMVSAGSLAAAVALPAAILCLGEWRPYRMGHSFAEAFSDDGWGPRARPVFWLALTLAVLVWVRHVPNIRRILDGTESRFGRKRRAAD